MKFSKSKLLSKVVKLIEVPDDLKAVTHFNPADEIEPKFLGMKDEDKDAIWSAVEMLYKSGVYPGISFCLRRHGEIVLNRSIGHAQGNGPDDDKDQRKVPMTPETPACLFSASKAITAMMVHLLDERGEINLLNPVAHYLPDFAQNGKQYITIQQLLNHRAGIPTIGKVSPEALFDYTKILNLLYAAEPNKNRKRLDYHAVTAGFILGELVRVVSGKDLREFLRENVQIPMDMKYFNYGCPPDQIKNVAVNYETGITNRGPINAFLESAVGATMEEVMTLSNDPRFFEIIVPAANIMSTAEESSRFWDMLMSNGEYKGRKIFDPLTIQRAVLDTGGGLEFDRTLNAPMRYSAGFMLGANPVGLYGVNCGKAYGHIGLTNNMCWADPERAISVSLLTTGNPVLGPHLPFLLWLITSISRRCSRVFQN